MHKREKKLKGILNKFYSVSAALTMCLGVSAAFADQAPNPRSATNVAKVSASRTDGGKVITRGAGNDDRASAVVSRSARAGGNVSARATTNTVGKTSYSRSAVKQVADSGRGGASVARSATNVKSNVARSAVKGGGAKQARSAAKAVSYSGLARAATQARATAVFNDISKIGGGYAQCRDSYATCMDQFCANANDTFRRCFCSSKFTEFRETEEMLDEVKLLLQRFEDNNLNAVDKTAAEVNAMYTATVGEAAIKNDVSGAQSILNEVGDLLSGKKKTAPANEPAGLMSVDFGVDMDNLWGSSNSLFDSGSGRGESNLSQLEGVELFNASNKQCLELVKDSCQSEAVLNMATSAYNIMITQDCNLYEKKIDSQKQAVQDTVRQAEKYLREARLDEYRSHNSADVNECITNVKKAMMQDMACGDNYRRCLDFSGLYINQTTGEPIYSTNLHKMVDVIKLDGSYDVLGQNRDFNAELDKKRTFAASALDSCRDIADTVWTEYKRTALIEIAQAQDEMLEEVKASCVSTMKDCYDANTGELKKMDTTTAQAAGAIAASAARTMCRDKVSACAALYGNGQCNINSNGKITNAKACGVEALLAFVNTVDAVKIAEGCSTSLTKYVTEELCAPLASETDRKYPWGCRNMEPTELEAAINQRYAVFCPEDLNDTGVDIDGGDTNVALSLIDTVKSELMVMYDDECTNLGGIWMENSNASASSDYLASRVREGKIEEQFYMLMNAGGSADAAKDTIGEYGICNQNSIAYQCAVQEEFAGAGSATYDEETGQCKFTDAWYKKQCEETLGGYFEGGICLYGDHGMKNSVWEDRLGISNVASVSGIWGAK